MIRKLAVIVSADVAYAKLFAGRIASVALALADLSAAAVYRTYLPVLCAVAVPLLGGNVSVRLNVSVCVSANVTGRGASAGGLAAGASRFVKLFSALTELIVLIVFLIPLAIGASYVFSCINASVLVSANGAFCLVYAIGLTAGASCFVKLFSALAELLVLIVFLLPLDVGAA